MNGTPEKIRRKLVERLSASFVEIVDESWKHIGHAGAIQGGGHFILKVVSSRFEEVSLLDRNRLVFNALTEEMNGEIHALTIRAMTEAEWEALSCK